MRAGAAAGIDTQKLAMLHATFKVVGGLRVKKEGVKEVKLMAAAVIFHSLVHGGVHEVRPACCYYIITIVIVAIFGATMYFFCVE